MASYSRDTYQKMFDQMLSQELSYNSSAATEANIRNAMKRILGTSIKKGLLRGYAFLVLDEQLNVHFIIIGADGTEFDIELEYGV